MNRQKSLKQFGLQQLVDENFHLNTSSSASVLNQSSFNNMSCSFNSNKLLQSNQNKIDQSTRKVSRILLKQKHLQSQEPTSLIKSKQMLEKFTNKLSALPVKRVDSNSPIQFMKNQIYETSFEINKQIDKKIQNTFSKLLNNQTLMPMIQSAEGEIDDKSDNQKQNFIPNALSLVQGTKMLMTQYWQKDKAKHIQTPKLSKKQSTKKSQQSPFKPTENLPKINERAYSSSNLNKNPNIILGKVSKHQKMRQELLKSKDQSLKLEFLTYTVSIVDYKIQNQSKQFLLFQRANFKKWESISFILNCLQTFCEHYQILDAKINLKKVLQLIEAGIKRQKLRQAFNIQQQPRSTIKDLQSSAQSLKTQYTTHQLLGCFEDAEKISQNHPNSKGIRFFGHRGKKRAIIKIQSQFRRFLCKKKFQSLKKIMQNVTLIQRKYRSYVQYCKTKQTIASVQLKKIQQFKQLQAQFKQNYRKNQITKKVKYEIHVCSMSSSEWQRVTTQNINERQNTELSRIFRIATKSTPLIQTRVIYIAPNELPKEIVNYYKKIFEFGSQSQQQQINNYEKLNILWPQKIEKLPQTLTLTQKLLYSKSTMKRLKRLIKGNYSYIVPSNPSNDFISLSCALSIPLYSSQPQKLLYLQTKAGCKQLAEVLKESKQQDSFGTLPYSMDIYNKESFINQLTFLIINYPQVRRWVLKIDNQQNSRGLAYIDTSKILKSQLLNKLLQPLELRQKGLKQKVYQKLYQTIVTFKQQKIIPLSKQIYSSQEQYLNHFLAYGGIIEASINNLQSDLENHCFLIQIQPDYEWKFIASYYKITNKNKSIGCYYDSTQQMQPPIQIELIVKQLIKRQLFGFFTLEFLKIPNSKSQTIVKQSSSSFNQTSKQNLTYFNGIQCHLNDLSSASFLKQFLSKDTNVLYIPYLPHPSLKQLRIQTFFHLCRLENISFDIQRKIGNVFMFLNGLQSGCMGLMSFNGMSKKQTFQQVSDVLQFLSSKLNQSTNLVKKLPKSFMSVRNVVNGFLKKDRNFRLSKQIRNSTTKSLNNLLSLRGGSDRMI